jgi:TRAP-type C4-dicarboxylate transport system permease small subunit
VVLRAWFARAEDSMLPRLRNGFERLLESIVILLMIALTVEVTLGVTYRKLGWTLGWYDEIASVTLAWLTYYGAALAALKGAHIGFPGILDALAPRYRVPLVVIGECFVLAFFIILAWTGVYVLEVLATDTLVSLPDVPVSYTQSAIPIGAALFVIAEALRLPELLRRARVPANLGERGTET